jgi:hypothetical protein
MNYWINFFKLYVKKKTSTRGLDELKMALVEL